MVSEKVFSHYKSMGANDPLGSGHFESPRGMVCRIYVGDHQTLLHTNDISCGPHGFKEEDFSSFVFHHKSMGANDPRGMVTLDPRSLIGSIYVGDHYALLHTKYISCEPHGFREEDVFLVFHIFKYLGVNDPRVMANLDPRGMFGRIYVGDH